MKTDAYPAPRHASRAALLHGVSLGALMVTAAAAQAAPFRSLNQALSLAGRAAQASVSNGNAVTASQQAALGAQNLAAAATRFRSLADALANPVPAGVSPIVVDGVGPGAGLQVLPGVVAGGAGWQGAALPTQAAGPSGVTVTVAQNKPLAQLTWQTFNVGARTTLAFDQSAGGALASSWVVINKVEDPTLSGSQILGQIDAAGKVYVLDRNGIAFGRGATINVGSLIAATADIAAAQFSTTASGVTSFNLYGAQQSGVVDAVTGLPVNYTSTFVNGTASPITVAPGAVIQTNAPSGTDAGGYVMLLGGNVLNQGIISTPLGQTVLAGGTAFTLRQGYDGSLTTGNTLSTTLGSEVAATNYGTLDTTGALSNYPIFSGGSYLTGPAGHVAFHTGDVENDGIVVADRGDISLVGHALTQAGVLLSTTTVDTRGTIHFLTPTDGSDPSSSITLTPGSVTEILPEDNGQTALDAQRAADQASSAALNAQRATLATNTTIAGSLNDTNLLADQLDESRVEISTGGAVDVGAGALVVAQGGQIAIGGGSHVVIEGGASLDVSGTTNSVLSADVNALNLGSTADTSTALSTSVRDLLVNVQPFQLRDSAANRDGGLKGTNVYVDAATLVEIASGPYAGNIYTPGGLLEVSGYLGLVPHTIGEWSAIGGQVTLQAQQLLPVRTTQANGSSKVTTVLQQGAVVTEPGSSINLQGGTVSYAAGLVPQTYLQAADGTIYNANTAPGDLVYDGIYAGDVVTHPRWNATFTYDNPLLTPASMMEPAYTVGRDAGSITINAATAVVQGAIYAGVTLGQYQDGPRPAGVTDPYLLAQSVVPLAGSLRFGNYLGGVLQQTTLPTEVAFQATEGPGVAVPALGDPIVLPVPGSVVFDAPALSAGGFASIAVSTGAEIAVYSPLAVATGGTLALTAADLRVDAGITAHAGAIVLTDQLASTGAPVAAETSISVAAGTTLDTRGIWTNERIDPLHIAGAGYANGGTITINGSNNVVLSPGSVIDVSSGGAILPSGAALGGRGGSMGIIAGVPALATGQPQRVDTVVLASTFVGVGSAGGGTLSLAAPDIAISAAPVLTNPLTLGPVTPGSVVVLDPSLFSSGFARYVVNGTSGLDLLPGTQISAAEPIYVAGAGLGLPSGSDPSSAYSVILPLLYTPVRGSDTLAQRAGASISLFSSLGGTLGLFPEAGAGGFSGGSVTIGQGAMVSVDPGQSITVAGHGQVSVLGTLSAHGGSIGVFSTETLPIVATAQSNEYVTSGYEPAVSIWLGAGSLVDVSGAAVVETDATGRRYGLAGAGGTISLGSLDAADPTLAQVIVRPGAVLDADGAAARVDVVQNAVLGALLPQSAPITLVGSGGTVALDSINGVGLDGTATARAGGAGAAGGTLSLTLDASNLNQYSDIPTYVFQPQQILVTQGAVPLETDPDLRPGQRSAPSTFGVIHASQQQVDAGGFDSLVLSAQTAAILFEGSVALHANQSIVLSTGVLGASAAHETVSVAAPYVGLYGETAANVVISNPLPPMIYTTSTLTVQADLIDQGGTLGLGGKQSPAQVVSTTPPLPGFAAPKQTYEPNVYGFGQADLDSSGDIRFGAAAASGAGQLVSYGNIAFSAAQLYPVSGQASRIIAGRNSPGQSGVPLTGGGTLTIADAPGAAAQAPYSVGGALTFIADDIVQGGIVRAPEGTLTFSDDFTGFGTLFPSSVTFAPGSVTSVSLLGQTIPYGGTVDGVTYLAPGGGAAALFQPVINVQAQSVDVQDGAAIDLRGGGTLSGAGFVFGRGGSTDVLTTPLLDIAGGAAVANAGAQVAAIQPVRSGDAVYAILPGYASAYAPASGAGDGAYTTTRIGEQISVAAGTVPGLAAGTYTLLPAYYALLPGGYRVELTAGTLPSGASLPQGNFTTLSPVTLEVANTAVASPVATAALFTSGANVRQLSQYDEESYNDFEASSATQFGAPRPFLPQDAKVLNITYPGMVQDSAGDTLSAIGTLAPALAFAPSALLQAPAPGGYGATLEIGFENSTNLLAVAGATTVPPAPGSELVLQDSTLDTLHVPRLVLGGALVQDVNAADTLDVRASAESVYVLPGAHLTAGEILLTTQVGGQIVIEPTGTISTIGAGPTAYDSSQGFLFNPSVNGVTANPVLDVSNGNVVFTPNTESAPGSAIVIGNASGVLAGGSLDVVAPAQAIVTIGAANLGAQSASISVAAINIGNQADLDGYAGQLPAGFDVTPAALSTLLNGNPALGTPAATQLVLTASQNVNIIGNVALDTGSTALVLNTPAIYGVGSAQLPGAPAPGTDTAAITAPRFVWNGVAVQQSLGGSGLTQVQSAVPGGQIAAALGGNTSADLSITAGTIVLGYGPQTQANDQVLLQRTVSGFANVTLTGTGEITANNQGALSVYASAPLVGQPGTGGNLSLVSPLITTDPAAVLDLAAGGMLSLSAPVGGNPASTAGVTTLGGEISAIAGTIAIDTTVALPSGQFRATAQSGIDLGAAAAVDLGGRTIPLFDQAVQSTGGTLALESTAGGITLEAGSRIDVSAPGAAAGSVSLSALAGTVAVDGTLLGGAPANQAGGSFTAVAGTLATTSQSARVAAGGSAFDNINASLDAGGFTEGRSFEFNTDLGPDGTARTDLVIDNDTRGAPLVVARTVQVTLDPVPQADGVAAMQFGATGSIDVTGTIDAAGSGPGDIVLSAHENVTLAPGALLDAHATTTAVDADGAPVDAENRAHVTLTSTAGSLLLDGGTVDLSYPGYAAGQPDTAQGQLVLNAPRVGGIAGGDVAIVASAPIAVRGAQSIALYAWTVYDATDANGTIVQSSSGPASADPGVISLDAIDAQNTAFMTAAGADAGLASRLAGLVASGVFHLRPGVEIDSTQGPPGSTGNSHGTLTISGDLNLAGYRYSDVGYGLQATGDGSGEPGSILFRAAGDLVVNGSVTDGFEAPPDAAKKNYVAGDDGWQLLGAHREPLDADVILPSSIVAYIKGKHGAPDTVSHTIELGAGSTFDESRPISLNYAITVHAANIGAGKLITFAGNLAPGGGGLTAPAGGFVTTAAITEPDGTVIPAGTYLAGGTVVPANSAFAAGSVFPVAVQVGDASHQLVIPAGTLLSIFDDGTLRLAADTAPLPVGALLPSGSDPKFVTPDGQAVKVLELRTVRRESLVPLKPGQICKTDRHCVGLQGYLYPLARMLPAGALSWSLDFVAGADQASADVQAVLPHSVLQGGALAVPANTANQAPGSLILDDEHLLSDAGPASANPAFSVIRTGTGDLSLVAGGNFDQSSLYGIYTAGTQTELPGGDAANAPYDLARESLNDRHHGVTPGGLTAATNVIIRQSYQANYPAGGGDVLVSAQGSVTGDLYGGANGGVGTDLVPSDAVGNWLWRQGSTQLGVAAAWWINFGTFAVSYAADDTGPAASPESGQYRTQLIGFQGIGALGGGNVTVVAGGDAGQTTDRTGADGTSLRGEGLVVAVGSTGRVVSSGGTLSTVETGGGDIDIRVAGTLNPLDNIAYGITGGQSDLNGTVIDLRGNVVLAAGAVGRVGETYSTVEAVNEPDPRPVSPYTPVLAPSGGITLMPGDGSVSIVTDRDLVLDGVGDPGRVTEQNLTALSQAQLGTFTTTGGDTGFSLWTPATAVSVFAAGGNVAPITVASLGTVLTADGNAASTVNDGPTDDRFVYPSQLYVTAASGGIVYGATANGANPYSLEVAPSPDQQVAFLAGQSIQANGMAVDLSGADPQGLSSPLNPAFTSASGALAGTALTDIRIGAGTTQSPLALFALAPDTPSVSYLDAAAAAAPALFYAQGDILNFISGETLTFRQGFSETLPQWYLAAKPVRIIAGQDIVNSGTRPTTELGTLQQNQQITADMSADASGNLFMNNIASDVSVVSAGRDILSGYFYQGGPGLLEVDAGRNIEQIGFDRTSAGNAVPLLAFGSIKSLGALQTGVPVSLTGGASVYVSAGLGSGADYAAFAALYLNPANLADPALPITDPANQGRVQAVYSAQLLAFLQQDYGYTGTPDAALAFFLNPANVAAPAQDAFLRGVFYAELLASGQQYNDAASRFFHSYERGRTAIDTLLPGAGGQMSTDGTPAGYAGSITMASGTVPGNGPTLIDAGVASERGGNVQVLDPGGQVVLGTSGSTNPGGGTGLITNGSGNIDVFSLGSVLLGKSRIFTNAGGNIQIWSAAGDINAGIGARTTVVFNPPVLSYDATGGIVELPAVPTSGAGIATEQPLPDIPAGNIDLTAPLGTIDAGEAGVRSSGNLNLAASRLANTSGFSAGGKTSGTAGPATVSLGSVEAAGAAAGAGQQAAQNLSGAHTESQLPSIIEVEVLSLSGESEEERRKKRK